MSIFYRESRLYEKVMHIARIGSTEFEIIYISIYIIFTMHVHGTTFQKKLYS